MPFNGMTEASFNVFIVRHLLIIKINLENILVPHNFYYTIFTFMDNWHTAWCIFTKSFKFASKISLKDLNSIDKSQWFVATALHATPKLTSRHAERDTYQSHLCMTLQSYARNHLICIIVLVGSHGIAHYVPFIHGYMLPEKQRVVHHGTWSWLWCHFSCDIYH